MGHHSCKYGTKISSFSPQLIKISQFQVGFWILELENMCKHKVTLNAMKIIILPEVLDCWDIDISPHTRSMISFDVYSNQRISFLICHKCGLDTSGSLLLVMFTCWCLYRGVLNEPTRNHS